MNSKPRILIVDDKPENLVALRKVLQDLDIDIVEASGGNEALRATLHNDFALALLDIQMPDMDGYELASILREEEKTAQLPFIFISAVYTDNLNVFKGYEKGAFSFITKPFQPEILINKVNFFIDKHRQQIELFALNKSLENKNEELRLINKELESFSYTVSHDLRAPIRAINGYSSILKDEFSDKLEGEAIELLQSIADNAIKMGTLIDHLLDFSRLGRKEMIRTDIDMHLVVQSAINELCSTDPRRKKIIEVQSLSPNVGDATLLKQVWINLISNALKYSGGQPAPHIIISSTQTESESIYSITDNGAGFDMRYYNKLFGVFQRLHNDSEFEGNGVGLAIVHRIVTRHGGRVWAESEPGKGATFSFSLPIIKNE
jgi:two-component system, sensor histidine kinase and response regulator